MILAQERARETRAGVSRREGDQITDWEAVIAAHHVHDWPPPEWLAGAGEAPSGVSSA